MADIRKPNEKDYITNKVLLVFTLCLFGVFGLMLLYRLIGYGTTYRLGLTVSRIVLGGGIALLAFGIFRIFWERKKQLNMQYRVLRGRYISIIGAIIAVCMILVQYFGPSFIKIFYVLLPVLAVYYLVYHSYPREFFVIALDSGIAALLLYIVRHVLSGENYPYVAYLCVAVALLLAAGQSYLVYKLQSSKKVIGLVDGKRVLLFTSAHAYQMMYLSALLLLVFVAAGAFAGSLAAYYLIFASLGYLFITAVYYTVKLM